MSFRTQGRVFLIGFALLVLFTSPRTSRADGADQAADEYYKALKKNRGASSEALKEKLVAPAKQKAIEAGRNKADSDYRNYLLQNDPRKVAHDGDEAEGAESSGSGLNPEPVRRAEPEEKPPVDAKDVPAEIVFPGAPAKVPAPAAKTKTR